MVESVGCLDLGLEREDQLVGSRAMILRGLIIVRVCITCVFARDSIYAKRAYAIAIPSVRLSVRHTGDSCKNG